MPRTTKTPSVSEKNTKSEIMAAYQALLSDVSLEEPDQFVYAEQKIVDTASKETAEKITTDLSQLKLSLNQTITKLTERLTEESERLATITKAIVIAQKELEHTQKIKVTAGMLYRMVEVQKQTEAAFEKEMNEKRKKWELEQKEYEERLKQERGRVEEEYVYEKALVTKRDIDERMETKRVFEAELSREKEVRITMVKELEDLRKRALLYPAELDKAVKDAVGRGVAEAKKEAEVARQLAAQEFDSELRLKQLTIDSLENTLKNQTADVSRLRTQLEEATRQIKDIAVSVIEGPKKESGEKGVGNVPVKQS